MAGSLVTDLLHDPATACTVVGVLGALVLSRTRFAKGWLVATAIVLVASVALAAFDGLRHHNGKFDTTAFIWALAVERRAVSGAAFVILGGPIGAVVGTAIRRRHGALLGVAALAPFGVGEIASSLTLSRAIRASFASDAPPEAKFGPLESAIEHATWWMGAGTAVSVVACVAVAWAIARQQRPA